jgi:hypothetical protein
MRCRRTVSPVSAGLLLLVALFACGPTASAHADTHPGVGVQLNPANAPKELMRPARRETAEAKQERRASRTRYRGGGRDDALALGRRFFPEAFSMPLFDARRLAADVDVIGYRGTHTAIAKASDGRRLLLQSTLPLQTKTPIGELAPVDLSLRESATTFTTANSPAGVQISEDADKGAELLSKGVAFAPATTNGAAGVQTEGRVFYSQTQTDTDFVVAPLPSGVEFSWLLRSADAPQRLVLDVVLPDGAAIHHVKSDDPIPGDPPRSLEIVSGDDVLAYVRPPLVYDADGVPVAAEMTVEDGDKIVLSVEHRDRDLRYPLFADPVVEVYGNQYTPWYGWSAYQVPATASPGTNYYGFRSRDCNYNCAGPYMSMPTNTRFNGTGTNVNYYFKAPPGSYIERAQIANVAHKPLLNGYSFSEVYSGILNPAGNAWESGFTWTFNNGATGTNPFGPYGGAITQPPGLNEDLCCKRPPLNSNTSDGNHVFLSLRANWPGVDTFPTNSYYAYVMAGAAAVYLGDTHPPSLTASPPSNNGWVDDSASPTHSIRAVAHDDGLGLNGITLAGAATGNRTSGRACTGHPWTGPCDHDYPDTFNYTLNEGINTLSLRTRDIVDNNTTIPGWQEKIDRSPPEVAVSGDLRDLAAGIDDSGRDLYGLNITATDGTPSAPRVGVRDVVVSVDGTEIERLASDPTCVESCEVRDEIFVDTDDLTEGPHTISVKATDRLGHGSPPVSWSIRVPGDEHYAAQLAAWKADVEQRVDNAVPLVPLSGPMPSPPDGWRNESDCEASTDALRACYEAIQTWGEAVRAWLTDNLTAVSLAGELPNPPTFEYTKASDSTSLELTRSTRDAFEIAKTALASPLQQTNGIATALESPLEEINVAIAFHDPVTPTAALKALPELAAPDQVALTGVFDPGEADISGTMSSPKAALLSEAIDDFYSHQITIAQEDIADVTAVVPEDADEAEVNQQFINEHEAFVAALQARQPFITGVSAKVTLPDLLDNLLDLDTENIIKTVRLLPADQTKGSGIEVLSSTRPNTAVIRSAQHRQAATGATATANANFPPGTPRCYDPGAGGRGPMRNNVLDPTPTYWAPSRESYNTSIGEPDGDHHLKVHRLRWRWKAAESLAWMCADSPGDRNVEIEAMVYPDDDERWSDNWESNNARKYTQHNGPAGGNIHQDDIASGDSPFQLPPGNPFDKNRFPDFAIVFQSSQEFRYRRLYKVRFVTNEGYTDDKNSRVIYSVQATKRASTTRENGYCTARRGAYQSCMFAATTACVDHARIEEPFRHARIDWRDIMGSTTPRLSRVRRDKPAVVDAQVNEVTARCDPRPPGSER